METQKGEDTREQIAALWSQFDHMWRYLGYKDEEVKAIRESDRMGASVELYRREIASSLQDAMRRAEQYLNVISLIGYAGYFATWSFAKAQLSLWSMSFIGLMGMASIAFFITWEVLMMILRSRETTSLAKLINRQMTPPEFLDELESLKAQNGRVAARFAWVWPVFLFLTIVPACLGGGHLIYHLGRPLLDTIFQ